MTGGRGFARPRVVLSKCLEVEACRYNGRMIRSAVVRALDPVVDFVPVCPEVEVGLGTPRDPIRLVRIGERTHLVQPSTDRDLTVEMEGFARRWLGDVGEVDGFILKSRSPSCGIDEIPVYPAPPAGMASDASPAATETGMFAREVLERLPSTPVEHEARLAGPEALDAFLTRIFALAGLRRVLATGRVAELVDFQARQKLTLMAHSPEGQKELGRLVANADGLPFDRLAARYRDRFREVLGAHPGPGAHQNVIQHAMGYVRDRLSSEERTRFLDLLDGYRSGAVERTVLLSHLRAWAERAGVPWLTRQRYLLPYPRELLRAGAPRGTSS